MQIFQSMHLLRRSDEKKQKGCGKYNKYFDLVVEKQSNHCSDEWMEIQINSEL